MTGAPAALPPIAHGMREATIDGAPHVDPPTAADAASVRGASVGAASTAEASR